MQEAQTNWPIIRSALWWFFPAILTVSTSLSLAIYDGIVDDPGCGSAVPGICFGLAFFIMFIATPIGALIGLIGLIVMAKRLPRKHYF